MAETYISRRAVILPPLLAQGRELHLAQMRRDADQAQAGKGAVSGMQMPMHVPLAKTLAIRIGRLKHAAHVNLDWIPAFAGMTNIGSEAVETFLSLEHCPNPPLLHAGKGVTHRAFIIDRGHLA
jgi:hypothetical protein